MIPRNYITSRARKPDQSGHNYKLPCLALPCLALPCLALPCPPCLVCLITTHPPYPKPVKKSRIPQNKSFVRASEGALERLETQPKNRYTMAWGKFASHSKDNVV